MNAPLQHWEGKHFQISESLSCSREGGGAVNLFSEGTRRIPVLERQVAAKRPQGGGGLMLAEVLHLRLPLGSCRHLSQNN